METKVDSVTATAVSMYVCSLWWREGSE